MEDRVRAWNATVKSFRLLFFCSGSHQNDSSFLRGIDLGSDVIKSILAQLLVAGRGGGGQIRAGEGGASEKNHGQKGRRK